MFSILKYHTHTFLKVQRQKKEVEIEEKKWVPCSENHRLAENVKRKQMFKSLFEIVKVQNEKEKWKQKNAFGIWLYLMSLAEGG